MASAASRRDEILALASQVVATSGLTLSVKDIADACGILPGSLYHHFDSKDAILRELVARYRDDLDQVAARATDRSVVAGARPVLEEVMELGTEIAACAMRHRAALLVTLYEPLRGAGAAPTGSDVVQPPAAIHEAVLGVLRAGQAREELRDGPDLSLLSERICQSMFHHGVGHSSMTPGTRTMPGLRCRILLQGIASAPPDVDSLDRSAPIAAARRAVSTWEDDDGSDRSAHIVDVARTAFCRWGFRPTKMRDIAAAAGIGVGTLYRCYPAKGQLLTAVMARYGTARRTGWEAVLAARSGTVVERLDALAYVHIELIARFGAEFRILLSLLRERPGVLRQLGSTDAQRTQLKQMLVAGERAGELQLGHGSADLYSKCLYELIGATESTVGAGVEAAHTFARDTILAGAAVRTGPRIPGRVEAERLGP